MTGKILVVDDERPIPDSSSKALPAECHEIVLAENGEQTIEKLAQESVDLLLLDLGLPVKDGWVALDWLAQVNPLLPVVVITGRWMQGGLAEAGARRIHERGHGFRLAPCGGREFCERLRRGYATPYPCDEAAVPKHP